MRSLAFALAILPSLALATGFTDLDPPRAKDETTVELHGALRLRGEGLYNLDLDRGVTPSGQPFFPVPLNDPNGQLLRHGDLRLRTDFGLVAPGGTLAVRVRADLLDGVAVGGTPAGDPMGTTTQRPSTAVAIKRAYGEAFTPAGLLAIGRMGHHWGLGMLANAGDCGDCDSGDAVDRVAFVTPLAGHIFAAAYDWSASGPLGVRRDSRRTLDLEPTDDVRSATLAILRWRTDRARERRLKAEKSTVDYGAYASYRWQENDVPASWIPVAAPVAIDPSQVVSRGYRAMAFDAWLRFTHPAARIELEAATMLASIEQVSLVPGVLVRGGATSTMFGAAMETEFGRRASPFRWGLDAGFASGDPAPGFGAFAPATAPAPKPGELDGPQANPPFDSRADNFRFHSDYRIDRILFREIIGTVTDAVYVRPHARLELLQLGPGRLSAHVAAVGSFAVEPASTPGGKRPLGIEIDPTLAYVHEDGFSAALEHALLLPLAGLDHPGGAKARPAQLLRLRLQLAF